MEQLALYGGTPVRERLLPYGQQWIDEDDIANVVNVLRGDYLTQGPAIAAFESRVAEMAGASYAVAFCNGTAALHGAMFAAGIGEGDEVVTTPLTFVATSNSVLYQGGTPVFADVDARTYLLDPELAAAKITPKTKAIAAVDLTGQPVNMRAFKKLAEDNGLLFIQDAAHSFGASYAGEPVGSVADMTMFSFHPVKPVTTGEGGVIVTNNPDFYEKMTIFRTHGITRDAKYLLAKEEGPWYYEMQHLGFNYRMTDLQATLGSGQLDKLEGFIARRNKLAERYNRLLRPLEEKGLLRLPSVDPNARSGWHIYVIQVVAEHFGADRKTVFEALRAENVGVNVHYMPVHLHPYYRNLGYGQVGCPVAEQLYDGFITLPLYPKMSDSDVEDVVRALEKAAVYFSSGRG